MAIVAHASSGWTSSSYIGWTNLTSLKMYYLMFGTIFKSCPKLITYLVSKTWVLMSLKISSKVFFVIVVYAIKWIGCLLVIGWLIGSSKLAQFEWSDPFKSIGAYDVKSPSCNSLIIRMGKGIMHLFFCFPINYCFYFHWFTFSKHLLL